MVDTAGVVLGVCVYAALGETMTRYENESKLVLKVARIGYMLLPL
jgi:hypothetical protein